MSKKSSKPFTEADLTKMGMIEVSPGIFKKPDSNYERISEKIIKECVDYHNSSIQALSVIQQGDAFYYIGQKYKFKPIAFIAIPPCSAPRMTRRDSYFLDPNHIDPKKRQRVCVTKYFEFKTSFKAECERLNISLTEILNVCFIVPMPNSWGKNKRNSMRYESHKQRPDRDNYLKAYQDAFGSDDGFVWDGRTLKIWGETGGMIIF